MAVEKIVNIKVNSNADKIEQDFKELNNEVKDTTKASEELGKTTDNITGGMVGKFKSLLSSVKTVISSFGLLKTAIIATGLGALLVAIVSIKQAFTSSEEGQNRYAKLLGIIGSVVGNITDLLTDLGNKLIWVFTHPKDAIMSFAKAVTEKIINRFTGLLQLIPALGKAISKLFSGDFKEAGKIATNAVGKVALGVEDLTGKINAATEATKEFIKEQQREARIAAEIADQRAKADKLDRSLIVQRAEADRKRAELLEKAQQRQNYTVKQRISFLKEASKLEEDITNKEIKAAILRRDAIIEENKLSNSNKEALQAEEEAKAKVIELETARLSKQKEVTGQISGLIEQERAIKKAAYDAEIAANKEKNDKILEAENKRLEEIRKLGEEEFNDYQKILDAETEYLDSKLLTDKEKELQANYDKYSELISLAEKHGEDTSVLLEAQLSKDEDIKKKYADKEIEKEKQLQSQKVDAVQSTFTTISNLAKAFEGKNEEQQQRAFKVQKAANTANALIDTYKSATGAYASLSTVPVIGPALGAAAAGAAIAAGLANVKAIQSQKFSASGSSGSVGSPSVPNVAGNTSTQQLSTPNFNVVGASGISQTENLKPVKAYVVSGEVTSAQSLDRNRIQNATF